MLQTIDTDDLKQARQHMKAGQFSLALSVMINDLKLHPENLPLLANIASCYYMAENYLLYKKYTQELLSCYDKYKSLISKKEMRSTVLALVRLLEELGEIYTCLKIIKDYQHDELTTFDKLDTTLLAQKLRLFSTYPLAEQNLVELYNHCRMINSQSHAAYVDIEGALLLADWSLFGEAMAIDRLNNFFKSKDCLDYQKRLLVFDHLFESLRTNGGAIFDLNLLAEFTYLEADQFEKFLWDQVLVLKNQEPHQPLSITRSDQMSTQGAFKVLHLLLVNSSDTSIKNEVSKKIGFLLNGVSAQSRAVILKAYPLVENSTTIELLNDQIAINGRVLPMQKCKTIFKLLSELNAERVQPTDTIIKNISGESFDTYSYAKMRVIVSRANTFLLKNSGFAKAFSITKESIGLNKHLQIVRRA